MSLIIQPWHIATRGRLDGEYGIATRGYVVCPDLVSRIPVRGDVLPDRLFGHITPEELEVVLRDLGWVGDIGFDGYGLDAVWTLASRLYAEVTGCDLLEAVVMERDQDLLVGIIKCLESISAQVIHADDGTVGEVDSGIAGSSAEQASVAGNLEERPGEGACRVDEDVEPC